MTSTEIALELASYIARSVERAGSSVAVNPGHRVPFHWPPHPESYSFHVLPSDWTGREIYSAHGTQFEVEVARTPYGVFGRCQALWHEARGKTDEEMLRNLARLAEPKFAREFAIAETLEQEGRFTDPIGELAPLDLLKLLYCKDRDVANHAHIEIETHASLGIFGESLVMILEDETHPLRRSAQWCVLDLFEDIQSYCETEVLETRAIQAMKSLLWNALDDYARTVFKAGVVLGGHLPAEKGGPVLIECLKAPSPIGRRSAIHGLFHVVEWNPNSKEEALGALRDQAARETVPALREFALRISQDIESGQMDHMTEPQFDFEAV